MKLADGESLLLKTYRRALSVVDALSVGQGELLTVTNRDYYFMSKDELARVSLGKHVVAKCRVPADW
ncbi:hypothetical protein Tfont_02220 [Tepidimonas fonticaldi]|uniref:Uncharacterized protein n=1 Tax=Tepidimonas fonticaldi TaxID=1101373 RepID=A0A554XIU0_9BURK|nr:hypothetical protein Tfont_02220 [Tepidimonas fonticaldi]